MSRLLRHETEWGEDVCIIYFTEITIRSHPPPPPGSMADSIFSCRVSMAVCLIVFGDAVITSVSSWQQSAASPESADTDSNIKIYWNFSYQWGWIIETVFSIFRDISSAQFINHILSPETESSHTAVMTREEDTYAMLDTRDWSRVSHVTTAGKGKPVIGRVTEAASEYGLKSLDNDWHTVLTQHLSGA